MTGRYDLIVVGAGPAGSLAAKTAAERGLKTLLVERGNRPGQKSVGGEFLPISIFMRFPWMREGPVQRAINRWAFFLPYEDKLTEFKFGRKDEFGFTVHRPEWDNWVSRFAQDAGARLKKAALIQDLLFDRKGFVNGVVTDKAEKFYSNVVIGADGSNSTVAEKARLRHRWQTEGLALCVKYTFSLPEREISRRFSDENGTEIEVFYTERVSRKGFGWIFPSKKDFCVGVGGVIGVAESNMHQYLQDFMSLPVAREKIRGAKLSEYAAHTVPTRGPQNKTYCDGLMLVGDAAGLACPFDGAGYEAAAYSGTIAAEVAEKAVGSGDSSGDVLSEYESRWRKSWVWGDIVFGSKIQEFMVGKVGIDNFNRILYETASAITKHGSYKDKSHEDSFTELISKHSEILKEVILSFIPFFSPFLEQKGAESKF